MSLADYVRTLADKPCYVAIERSYTAKISRRSGVPYIAHINEGAYLLHQLYDSDEDTVAAFCVHPLFQSERSLRRMFTEPESELDLLPQRVIVLAMEYRRLANAYTISDPVREPERIEIGFFPEVRQMLCADKMQNKKDFMKHIYKSQARTSFQRASERGERYFDSWFQRLEISEEMYQRAACLLKDTEC